MNLIKSETSGQFLNQLSVDRSVGLKNCKQFVNNKTVVVREKRFRDKLHLNQCQLQERKKFKTNVFSGNTKTNTTVNTLKELCVNKLTERIDKLIDFGEAPYYVIKPILKKCTSLQLTKIEKNNPKLITQTDELWFELCTNELNLKRDINDHNHNNSTPNKTLGESWRQFYHRLTVERKKKLDYITASIQSKKILEQNGRKMTLICETGRQVPNDVKRRQDLIQKKPKVAPLMKKCLLLKRNSVIRS